MGTNYRVIVACGYLFPCNKLLELASEARLNAVKIYGKEACKEFLKLNDADLEHYLYEGCDCDKVCGLLRQDLYGSTDDDHDQCLLYSRKHSTTLLDHSRVDEKHLIGAADQSFAVDMSSYNHYEQKDEGLMDPDISVAKSELDAYLSECNCMLVQEAHKLLQQKYIFSRYLINEFY